MRSPIIRALTTIAALVVVNLGGAGSAGEYPTSPENDIKGYYWSSAMPLTGFCAGSHAVSGGAVTGAQTALVAHGYYLDPRYPVDGLFGAVSTAATIQFQRARGITIDGCIGPETWSALQAPLIRSGTAPSHQYFLEGLTCCHADFGRARWFEAGYNICGVWTLELDDSVRARPYTSGPPASLYQRKHLRMAQPGPLFWTVGEYIGGC